MSQTHKKFEKTGYLEDQREFFDSLITEDWETYQIPAWDEARRFEVRKILDPIPAPRRVLDVGCGAGFHDVEFAQAQGVEEVWGIDYSEKSIEQANRHYPHAHVQRMVADIHDPDLLEKVGRFDLVASFQVIEHLKDPRRFLRACASLTSPGGFIAVVTPNQLRLENRMRLMVGKAPVMIDPMHFREYSRRELVRTAGELELRAIGSFGHTLQVGYKGFQLVPGASRVGIKLGGIFPTSLADVIGLVFEKD